MKKIIIATIMNFISGFIYAQSSGIHFERISNWQQVLEKAKAEHKFIFVDCYATWCGPCKKMDAEVYPDPSLGKFINDQFLSVKVQMDTSKFDNGEVKAWYDGAHKLMTEDKVSAFPSFLFFTPDGKLLHKEVGYHDALGFLQIALAAKDPVKQEYALLDKFNNGKLPDSDVPRLITLLKQADDNANADLVSNLYIKNYVLKLPDELLYKPANINLLSQNIKSSSDPVFTMFYHNTDKIDQAIQKGYAESVVTSVITKEEINPKLWSDAKQQQPLSSKPDWVEIHNAVSKKYSKPYADEALTGPQITWYKQHKQWKEYIDLEIPKIEKNCFDDKGHLKPSVTNVSSVNNVIYEYIFMYSNDLTILNKAIDWSKMIIATDPNEPDYLDTYANLLYKTGKKKEALEQESKAVQLDIEKANKNKGKPNPDFAKTLDAMKAGKITWDTTYQSN